MLQMPMSEIYAKMREKSGLSDDEITAKIDAKLKQLSGLVSKEGAAHIVANELGIRLFEKITGRLQVKNILAGMRDVEVVGKVMAVYEVREFKGETRSGKLGSFIIGDETGTIRAVCWNDKAEAVKQLSEGAIVKIGSAYVRENNGRKELHLNERSILVINPPGEAVAAVAVQQLSQKQSVRKRLVDISGNDTSVSVLATVVQSFEPHFFETCPNCSRRLKPAGASFVCDEHKEVLPSYAYVMNAILDDGTETMRAVFFRNQANQLLNSKTEDILPLKEAPERFEALKQQLLGKIVLITGRASENKMFNRVELIASDVNLNPDPAAELRLLAEAKKA